MQLKIGQSISWLEKIGDGIRGLRVQSGTVVSFDEDTVCVDLHQPGTTLRYLPRLTTSITTDKSMAEAAAQMANQEWEDKQ